MNAVVPRRCDVYVPTGRISEINGDDAHQALFMHPDWGSYHIFANESAMRASDNFVTLEEELVVCGQTVTWSAGGVVKRSYQYGSPVIQARMANFDSLQGSALCVLLRESMRVYASSGEEFSVMLPCPMSRMWRYPHGLILERDSTSKGDLTYFTLVDPLHELKPLPLVINDGSYLELTLFVHPRAYSSIRAKLIDLEVNLNYTAAKAHSELIDRVPWRWGFSTLNEMIPDLPSPLEPDYKLKLLFTFSSTTPILNTFLIATEDEGVLLCLLDHSGLLRFLSISFETQPSLLLFSIPSVTSAAPVAALGHRSVQYGSYKSLAPTAFIVAANPSPSFPMLSAISLFQGIHFVSPISIAPQRTSAPFSRKGRKIRHSLSPMFSPRVRSTLPRVSGSLLGVSPPAMKSVSFNTSPPRNQVATDSGVATNLVPGEANQSIHSSSLTEVEGAIFTTILMDLAPPVQIHHSVGSCVSITNSDISQTIRVQLSLLPNHPHVNEIYAALSQVLSPSTQARLTGLMATQPESRSALSLLISLLSRDSEIVIPASALQLCNSSVQYATSDWPTTPGTEIETISLLRVDEQISADEVARIVLSLHFSYEGAKLRSTYRPSRLYLATALKILSSLLGWESWVEYYARDYPFLLHYGQVEEFKTAPPYPDPPSLHTWVQHRIQSYSDALFPMKMSHSPFTSALEQYCSVISDLYTKDLNGYDHNQEDLIRSDLDSLIRNKLSLSFLSRLSPEFAAPLVTRIDQLRLLLNVHCTLLPLDNPELLALLGRPSVTARRHVSNRFVPASASPSEVHGTELTHPITLARFSEDTRLLSVQRQLCSSLPSLIAIPPSGVPDSEIFETQQRELRHQVQRTIAQPFGRGLLTYAALEGESSSFTTSSPLPIPEICLEGRIQGTAALLDLDMSSFPVGQLVWPLFHNGVATGLRYGIGPPLPIATYAPPRQADPTNMALHAGILLALGLQGRLASLPPTRLYAYLSGPSSRTQQVGLTQPLTAVALLIGLTASRLGSQDTPLSRLLAVHLPSIHPSAAGNMEVPPIVQNAALFSYGLLYCSTANRRVAEILMGEIVASPNDEKGFDREAYSLSAGIGLGFTLLGRGRNARGLFDLAPDQKLLRLVLGGLRKESHASSLYLEGKFINTDLTAPPALVALAMFLIGVRHLHSLQSDHQTNDRAIADQLCAPSTVFDLESVRPDALMMRVITVALIMWDEVAPTPSWIEAHLPPIVRDSIPSSNPVDALFMFAPGAVEPEAWCFILQIAGACFALGLRFSGSLSLTVASTIRKYLHTLHLALQKAQSIVSAAGPVRGVSVSLLTLCRNTCLTALCLVLAGTGDLETLRIIRTYRRQVGKMTTFGSHMNLSLATGLLFLGGGRYSLSSSHLAVGALLAAFYPKYPIYAIDNHYHVQALRHLSVLSFERRAFACRDMSSGVPVKVQLRVELAPLYPGADSETIELITPALLPPLHRVKSVIVGGYNYAPRQFLPQSRPLDACILYTDGYFTVAPLRLTDPFSSIVLGDRSFPPDYYLDPSNPELIPRSLAVVSTIAKYAATDRFTHVRWSELVQDLFHERSPIYLSQVLGASKGSLGPAGSLLTIAYTNSASATASPASLLLSPYSSRTLLSTSSRPLTYSEQVALRDYLNGAQLTEEIVALASDLALPPYSRLRSLVDAARKPQLQLAQHIRTTCLTSDLVSIYIAEALLMNSTNQPDK